MNTFRFWEELEVPSLRREAVGLLVRDPAFLALVGSYDLVPVATSESDLASGEA